MREGGVMGFEWMRFTAGAPEWARSMFAERISMILHTAQKISDMDKQ